MDYTHVEVEPNPNSPMSANLVFKNLAEPFPVTMVRIFEGEPEGRLCGITGWSSAAGGSPVEAHAVQVEDSGSGAAFLVYGGDWGVRMRPAEATDGWDGDNADQWGETHLVLADAADLIAADAKV
jgi:hypothetical protein